MTRHTERFALVICALLLACPPPASAQTPSMTVRGSRDATTFNPALVNEMTTTPLHATVADAPTAAYPNYLQGPMWAWTVQAATVNSQSAPLNTFTAWTSPPAANGDSILTASFPQPGSWVVTLQVMVTYTDLPGSNTWRAWATVNVPITVLQITLSPNPVLVPIGGAAIVTVTPGSEVSFSDVAVATDNPSIATISGSMPNFTVNGLQPGMTMCYCSFQGRRCMPSVPVYCWQANLMMSALIGASKLDPGAFVPLNANNDNGSTVTNGIPATRDFDVSPSPNEKDLVQIVLDATGLPANAPLTWNLSAPTSGHAVVMAWTTATKTAAIGLPYSIAGAAGSDPVYWLEGTAEGYALKEISLTLQVTVGSSTSTDVVKVTVTPVLQSLSVLASENAHPDLIKIGTDWYIYTNVGSAANTPSVTLSGKAYNTAANGQLAFIQNTQIANYLQDGTKGASRTDNLSWMLKFGVVNEVDYAGKVLLDSDADNLPYYVLIHNVAAANGLQVVTDQDAQHLLMKSVMPAVLGGVEQPTTIDFGFTFTTYAVWKYPDGSFYPLGNTNWGFRAKGAIAYSDAKATEVLTADPTLNKINPGNVLNGSNVKPDILVPPIANDANAAWHLAN